MADYIETFYNPARRHSSLNYLTPDEYDALHCARNPGRILIKTGPPVEVNRNLERTTGFEPATLTLAR